MSMTPKHPLTFFCGIGKFSEAITGRCVLENLRFVRGPDPDPPTFVRDHNLLVQRSRP